MRFIQIGLSFTSDRLAVEFGKLRMAVTDRNRLLSDAGSLILYRTALADKLEETAVSIAEDIVRKSIEKVNAFIKTTCINYLKKVEAIPRVCSKICKSCK